jgi:hypothetical protein
VQDITGAESCGCKRGAVLVQVHTLVCGSVCIMLVGVQGCPCMGLCLQSNTVPYDSCQQLLGRTPGLKAHTLRGPDSLGVA